MKRILVWFLGWLLFSIMYSSPLLMEASTSAIEDSRVEMLAADLITTRSVWVEGGRAFVFLLFQITVVYVVLSIIGVRVSRRLGISQSTGSFFVILVGWMGLVAINAQYFPLSGYSIVFSRISGWIGIMAGALFLCALLLAMRTFKFRWIFCAATVITLILCVGYLLQHSTRYLGWGGGEKNVIIIGVDSLSGPLFSEFKEKLPALSALYNQSIGFERAYTSLGRTYPAWITILSGEPAAQSSAYFNLTDLDKVDSSSLISFELREKGYHSVFGLDERRFNNMDESFGFDGVVGPKVGAVDFVIQSVNDTPVANFFAQLGFSKYFMPYSRLNVASAQSYDATGFVNSVLEESNIPNSLFLAVHFESAHFPFRTRHASRNLYGNNVFLSRHVRALTVVDKQVALLIEGLSYQGRLNDALVIVLSDHGEGLGRSKINASKVESENASSDYGHGSNLLSEDQNRIVFGVLVYKDGVVVNAPAIRRDQVSLLDVKEIISSYVEDGEFRLPALNKCIPVETGIRFSAAANYRKLNELELAREGAGYYVIDGKGRLVLRNEKMKELVGSKDFGYRCSERITVYSSIDSTYRTYKLDDLGRVSSQISLNANDVSEINIYKSSMLSSLGE